MLLFVLLIAKAIMAERGCLASLLAPAANEEDQTWNYHWKNSIMNDDWQIVRCVVKVKKTWNRKRRGHANPKFASYGKISPATFTKISTKTRLIRVKNRLEFRERVQTFIFTSFHLIITIIITVGSVVTVHHHKAFTEKKETPSWSLLLIHPPSF